MGLFTCLKWVTSTETLLNQSWGTTGAGFEEHVSTLSRTHTNPLQAPGTLLYPEVMNSWAMNASKTTCFYGCADTCITTAVYSIQLRVSVVFILKLCASHFRYGQVSPYQRQAGSGDPQQSVWEEGTDWSHPTDWIFCRDPGTEPPVGQSSWYGTVCFWMMVGRIRGRERCMMLPPGTISQ